MILRTVLGSVAFVGLLILNNCATAESAPRPSQASAAVAPSLDGHSYDVKLAIPGKPAEMDGLVFEGGRFESSECTKLGFPQKTAYEARRSEEGIVFNVTTKHPQGTMVEWKGVVRNGKISGTAKLTMNGEVTNGTFEGAERQSAAAPSVAAR